MTISSKIHRGRVYRVGSLFWVDPEFCIGFTNDAEHPAGLRFYGWVDSVDCVEVLGVEDEGVVVKILKRSRPRGHQCPHGLVYMLSPETLLSWAEATKDFPPADLRSRMVAKYALQDRRPDPRPEPSPERRGGPAYHELLLNPDLTPEDRDLIMSKIRAWETR